MPFTLTPNRILGLSLFVVGLVTLIVYYLGSGTIIPHFQGFWIIFLLINLVAGWFVFKKVE